MLFKKELDLKIRFNNFDLNNNRVFKLIKKDFKNISNLELINPTINGKLNGSFGCLFNIDNNYLFKIPRSIIYNNFKIDNQINYFNPDILEALSRKEYKKLKYSTLPLGELSYRNQTIGLIYKYFKNYHNLNNLINENKDYLYYILELAIRNIMELLEYDIYHEDLKLDNILYKNEDVQIIDFDSNPYIKFNKDNSNYANCYIYFITGLINILINRTNDITIKNKLNKICDKYMYFNDIDSLYLFFNEIKSKNLVK